MFYLSICLQRGQGDWTLQEADRTDQRTGHCAVSWKQLRRRCAAKPLFLFTLVAAAAVTRKNVSIDKPLSAQEPKWVLFWACASSAESVAFFFITISRGGSKIMGPNWIFSLRISPQIEHWKWHYLWWGRFEPGDGILDAAIGILFIAPLAPLKHACASLYVLQEEEVENNWLRYMLRVLNMMTPYFQLMWTLGLQSKYSNIDFHDSVLHLYSIAV